jgi:plastocyanin
MTAKLPALVAAAVLAAVLAACGDDDAPAAAPTTAPRTVRIADFTYAPATLTVARGTPVTFVNEDTAPHTATGDGLQTGDLRKGRRRTVTLRKPGTIRYVCEFHAFMSGTVVVR